MSRLYRDSKGDEFHVTINKPRCLECHRLSLACVQKVGSGGCCHPCRVRHVHCSLARGRFVPKALRGAGFVNTRPSTGSSRDDTRKPGQNGTHARLIDEYFIAVKDEPTTPPIYQVPESHIDRNRRLQNRSTATSTSVSGDFTRRLSTSSDLVDEHVNVKKEEKSRNGLHRF